MGAFAYDKDNDNDGGGRSVRGDERTRARRPETKAPGPRGAAASPWSSSLWSSLSAGQYLRREQSRRESTAEDEDDNNNGKALLRLSSKTMRLGRDPLPPRQLAGFIIQPNMESMEGVRLRAGHVGRDDPPPLSSSRPPSAVVASWVNDDHNDNATMTARPPSPLSSPRATAALNGQSSPLRGLPLISSLRFGR